MTFSHVLWLHKRRDLLGLMLAGPGYELHDTPFNGLLLKNKRFMR